MRDEFFGVVRRTENSTDCCALEAPLFLVGKGKDKAAGDKQKSNQLIHPPLALGWASDRPGATKPPSAKALPHRLSPPQLWSCHTSSTPSTQTVPEKAFQSKCQARSSCGSRAVRARTCWWEAPARMQPKLWEVFLTLSMKSSKIWSILVLLLCVKLTALYSWEKFPQVKMSEIYGFFFLILKLRVKGRTKRCHALLFPFSHILQSSPQS